MSKSSIRRQETPLGDVNMTPRYAPSTVLVAGVGAVPVVQYKIHPAGAHPHSPIRNDVAALELVTGRGARWYGIVRGYINSELKMVVEGTNPRDEVRMKWKVVPKKFRIG